MKPADQESHRPKTVMVCPLDWGIGHATRCVPVIRGFLASGCRVVIAADGYPAGFLRGEFPELEWRRLPGIKIHYSAGNSQAIKLLSQVPRFLLSLFREYRMVNKLVRELGVDLLISDNRYGCRSRNIPSVLITHQLNLDIPVNLRIFKALATRLNHMFIRSFTECWIPDFEAHHGLSGHLSHPNPLPGHSWYIGPLSRFNLLTRKNGRNYPPSLDLLVMLSGPEPQRTMMEELLVSQLEKTSLTAVVVRGIPGDVTMTGRGDRIRIFDHLETSQLFELMVRANLVICRSGYSSIMDLVTLGRRAVLIPTPGQTEQEYLAKYMTEKKVYLSVAQSQFDLIYAIEMSANFHGMLIDNNEQGLTERIGVLLRRLQEPGVAQTR